MSTSNAIPAVKHALVEKLHREIVPELERLIQALPDQLLDFEQADPEKKKAFVASILSSKFHNQAAAGAESALSCIMARTAAYTGREITWEETLRSKEVWDAHLDLNKLVAK